MGTEKEIISAVKVIKDNGQSKICILHCISLYPLDYKIANLKNITMLRKKFKNTPIGCPQMGQSLPLTTQHQTQNIVQGKPIVLSYGLRPT